MPDILINFRKGGNQIILFYDYITYQALPVHSSEELLKHIKACMLNGRESQKEIYRSFYGYAMSVCCRYTNNHEDAIEILNDGFLKVFTSIKLFKPFYSDVSDSFKGWLRRIMIYTAIDHCRRYTNSISILTINESHIELSPAYENVLDKISYDEIIKAVQHLSPAYRTVFNLYVVEGFTHEEIGAALGVSTGTSKSNLFKARQHLQKTLNHHFKSDLISNAI